MKTNGRPSNHKELQEVKKYMKLSEIDKEKKIRIVQNAIGGWIDWEEKNEKKIPHRYESKPKNQFNPDVKPKKFWALYVWDYDRKDLFILEIQQASVLNTLNSLGEEVDLLSIDLKVKKEGSGMQTKYSVIPCPPAPLAPEIKTALIKSPVMLEALFEGDDPWDAAREELFLAAK